MPTRMFMCMGTLGYRKLSWEKRKFRIVDPYIFWSTQALTLAPSTDKSSCVCVPLHVIKFEGRRPRVRFRWKRKRGQEKREKEAEE